MTCEIQESNVQRKPSFHHLGGTAYILNHSADISSDIQNGLTDGCWLQYPLVVHCTFVVVDKRPIELVCW